MKFADLSPAVREKIAAYQYDRIIEKHEGPELWRSALQYKDLEFLEIAGRTVLLPVDREQHGNITFLRIIASADGQTLTLFLKDTTYTAEAGWDEKYAGFVAVCDRVPGEDFYLAVLYHEWFVIEPPRFN